MYVLKVIEWDEPLYIGCFLKQIKMNPEDRSKEFIFVEDVADALQFADKKSVNNFIRVSKLNVGIKNFEIEVYLKEENKEN